MITAMLREAERADPAKLAIVCGAERIRYDELAVRVRRFAGGLRALGVGAGDCVAVALPNGPEFVIAFLAAAALRAISLPLNPQYTRGELQRFVVDGRARVIIAGGAGLEACRIVATESSPRIPLIAVGASAPEAVGFEDICGADVDLGGPSSKSDRVLYLYTSGSTDTYKRICCTQENLWFEAKNFIETVQLTKDDTILCTIPLFHSYGVGNCLLDALFLGATLVILEQPVDGPRGEVPFLNQCGRVADLIRQESIRFFPGVPYQFSVLAGLPDRFPIDFRPVRLCISSSDFLPKRTYDRFLQRFGLPIRSLYGSTEAGSIAIDLQPAEWDRSISLATPLQNVSLEIRNADGAVLDVEEQGEIWVKSPTLPPSGYDNRLDLTKEVFQGGHYRTGDIGALDSQGRLTINGRKQSVVDIAGYKVDLGEVEEVLLDCPGIREAAALGVAIPNMGTLIKAVVVADEGLRESQIRAFCRARLAFVKVPRIIEFCTSLPRASTGKVLRSELSDVTTYLNSIADPNILSSVKQLQGASTARRRKLVRSIVQAQAAAVLGLGVREAGDDQGFTALGMDSFASIELRARLEYLFGCELPETMTFDHPTVAAVVDYLLEILAFPSI